MNKEASKTGECSTFDFTFLLFPVTFNFCLLTLIFLSAACGSREALHNRPQASPGPDVVLPADYYVVSSRVERGATMASLLRGNDIGESEIAAVIASAGRVFDLRKVRAAQPYRLEEAVGGWLRRFEYEIDGDRFVRVSRADVFDPLRETFVAELLPIEKMRRLDIVRGTVDRETPSLFAAMEAAGERVDLSIAVAAIFGGEIDFNVDVRPGDRFELLVEKQYRTEDGSRRPPELAGYGPILAAAFDNGGRQFRAVRFTPAGGTADYYDERGVSLRRFFLRSPLKFVPVVSSGFSRSRLHPILREYRPHLGVDYKAPIGAPVIAVANGVVIEAGVSGGAGRMVHLRHANGFESEYLHLSSITVRRGARVRQGDLIGRVGASGLATGPHLDYRLKKNGVFINPLTAHRAMPPGEPVPASQMAPFAAARDRALAQLVARPVRSPAEPVTAHQQ
jgi:murein DD-endopeptidase MepM/ murein hydrolase activator NlpD